MILLDTINLKDYLCNAAFPQTGDVLAYYSSAEGMFKETRVSVELFSKFIFLKFLLPKVHFLKILNLLTHNRGGGVGPASGRLRVRIPAATNLRRKSSSDSSIAKRSTISLSVTSPRR